MCTSSLLFFSLSLRTEYRRQAREWFSESDVSDIVESDSTPQSPVVPLVAVDGVQPELQHTPKESELVSKLSSHKNAIKNDQYFL